MGRVPLSLKPIIIELFNRWVGELLFRWIIDLNYWTIWWNVCSGMSCAPLLSTSCWADMGLGQFFSFSSLLLSFLLFFFSSSFQNLFEKPFFCGFSFSLPLFFLFHLLLFSYGLILFFLLFFFSSFPLSSSSCSSSFFLFIFFIFVCVAHVFIYIFFM